MTPERRHGGGARCATPVASSLGDERQQASGPQRVTLPTATITMIARFNFAGSTLRIHMAMPEHRRAGVTGCAVGPPCGERAVQPFCHRSKRCRAAKARHRCGVLFWVLHYAPVAQAPRAYSPRVAEGLAALSPRRGSPPSRCGSYRRDRRGWVKVTQGNQTVAGPASSHRSSNGGQGRNRTGVRGFAGRCMTTLPPSRVKNSEPRARRGSQQPIMYFFARAANWRPRSCTSRAD